MSTMLTLYKHPTNIRVNVIVTLFKYQQVNNYFNETISRANFPLLFFRQK